MPAALTTRLTTLIGLVLAVLSAVVSPLMLDSLTTVLGRETAVTVTVVGEALGLVLTAIGGSLTASQSTALTVFGVVLAVASALASPVMMDLLGQLLPAPQAARVSAGAVALSLVLTSLGKSLAPPADS
jgi:hypothetical protein